MLCMAGSGGECSLGRPASQRECSPQRPEESNPPKYCDAPSDSPQNHGEGVLVDDNDNLFLLILKLFRCSN